MILSHSEISSNSASIHSARCSVFSLTFCRFADCSHWALWKEERAMERLSNTSRSALYKISQIAKTKQIARRWHKLATITAVITGIKHILLMKQQRPRFPHHYGYDDKNEEEEILLRSGHDLKTSGDVPGDVSEGYLAVYAVEEERSARFVIPVGYLKHPFFVKLLHKAEDEFAFNYRNGGLTLPCDPSVLAHIVHLLNHARHHHHHVHSVDTAEK